MLNTASRILLAFVLLLSSGCIRGQGGIITDSKAETQATAFQQVDLNPDKNPPTIWMQREVHTEDAKGNKVVYHGLFACYRSDAPAAPKCFLAEIVANDQDLRWPVNP